MNIWEREANDIRNYLQRHGYDTKQGADHIIVLDPVYMLASFGNRLIRICTIEVVIRDWPQAVRFVDDRS